MSEHAGDVVPPRVSVDRAAGFIVAVLLGPGVEEVADLPRRVAGAAPVHFEDEREEARPGWGAERGRGRHVAVEAVAFAAGRRVSGGHAHAAVEVALGGADARAPVGRAVDDGDVDDGGFVGRRVRFGLEVGAQDAEVGVAAVQVGEVVVEVAGRGDVGPRVEALQRAKDRPGGGGTSSRRGCTTGRGARTGP